MMAFCLGWIIAIFDENYSSIPNLFRFLRVISSQVINLHLETIYTHKVGWRTQKAVSTTHCLPSR
ncbi:hypothetical protein PSPTOT1_0576 [Pseudomonas syringae pv. tomato T1]|nr:hypothetical protein PSPTOT1_0576 [Pseudomonas syringae pv. tomato T1]